jgi:cation transport ATPase
MFVFFLLSGPLLELRLRDRTAGSLEALSRRLPDSVERQRADGSYERVAVRRLAAGDVVRVLPGEAFPPTVRCWPAPPCVDEALLTGESRPCRAAWARRGGRQPQPDRPWLRSEGRAHRGQPTPATPASWR